MAEDFSYGSIYAEKNEFSMSWKNTVVNVSNTFDRSPHSSFLANGNISQYSPVTRSVAETTTESRIETPKQNRPDTPTDPISPKSPAPETQNVDRVPVKCDNDENGEDEFNYGIAGSRIMDNPALFIKPEVITESATAKTVALTQKLAFRPMAMPNRGGRKPSSIPTAHSSNHYNNSDFNKTKSIDLSDRTADINKLSISSRSKSVSLPNVSVLTNGKECDTTISSTNPFINKIAQTSPAIESKVTLTSSNSLSPSITSPTITPLPYHTITSTTTSATEPPSNLNGSDIVANIRELSRSANISPPTTVISPTPTPPHSSHATSKPPDSSPKQPTIISKRVPYMAPRPPPTTSVITTLPVTQESHPQIANVAPSIKPLPLSVPELPVTFTSSCAVTDSILSPIPFGSSTSNASGGGTGPISDELLSPVNNPSKKIVRGGFLEEIEDAVSVKSKSSQHSDERYSGTYGSQYAPVRTAGMENSNIASGSSSSSNSGVRREPSVRGLGEDEQSSSFLYKNSSGVRPPQPTSNVGVRQQIPGRGGLSNTREASTAHGPSNRKGRGQQQQQPQYRHPRCICCCLFFDCFLFRCFSSCCGCRCDE